MGYGNTILLLIPMSISLQQVWIFFSLPVQQFLEILLNFVFLISNPFFLTADLTRMVGWMTYFQDFFFLQVAVLI